jgi:arylsulfatase A-like enzyme
MAGIKPGRKLELRGEDFTPVLTGKTRRWDPNIYLQYSMKHGATTHMRGVRTPDWKLMIDLQHKGRVEMFDLENDPHERVNLATSDLAIHKEQLKRLTGMVRNHMQSTGDPLLEMFP